MPNSPDTVTEAVQFLQELGYRDEARLTAAGFACDAHGDVQPLTEAVVDYEFRFEGPSDPADEAIVLGITCPTWGQKAVLVSAFGPGADPETADLLKTLLKR